MENKLIVHAGHGLTYRNIGPVAAIEGLCEFNIGHSIVSRAIFVGMRQAAEQMIALIDKFGVILDAIPLYFGFSLQTQQPDLTQNYICKFQVKA